MNWDSFYPPMVGSFLGVGLGILANHYYQEYIADKNKEKYKRMIKSEIELSIKRLEKDLIKFLPFYQWTSVVNSGGLKLFDVEKESGPLGVLYERIKDFNYVVKTGNFNDAKRVDLESQIDCLTTLELKKIPTIMIPGILTDERKLILRLLESRIKLLKELRRLNNAEWLKPSNEPAPGFNDAFRYGMNER